MHRPSIFLAGLLVLVAASAASAEFVSVTTIAYEADALPEDSVPMWYDDAPEVVVAEILPPGILRVVVDSDPQQHSNGQWWVEDVVPSGQDIAFIETRVQVVSASSQNRVVELHYDTLSTWISAFTSAVNAQGTVPAFFNHSMDTTDDFHTYRLEMDRLADVYRFYVDGELIETMAGVWQSFISPHVGIGRFSPGFQGEFLIDYVRAGVMVDPIATESASWTSVKALYAH